MDGGADVVGEFVEGGEKAEKLSEPGADGDGEKNVPNEEFDDGCFGDVAFLPSDFGVKDVGDEDGGGSADEAGEPEKIVILDDEVGKDGVEAVIKNRDSDTDENVADGAFAGLDVGGGVLGGGVGSGILVGFVGGFGLVFGGGVGSHAIYAQ